MTDEVISSGQSAPEQVSEPVNTNVAHESAPTASESEPQAQSQQAIEPETRQARVYSRDEVNRIAAHAAESAREKARADYERSKQYGMVGNAPQQQQGPQQGFDAGAQSGPSLDALRTQLQQIAFEESLRVESEGLVQKIVTNKERYQDFEMVTDHLNNIVTSDTAGIYNSFDNAADMLYYLGKNPEAIPDLAKIAADYPFHQKIRAAARKELEIISSQLKSNELAKVQPKANKPVEHEKPSTAGMDSGKMTIDDLRKQDYLRG
jgi:hypothetical protein